MMSPAMLAVVFIGNYCCFLCLSFPGVQCGANLMEDKNLYLPRSTTFPETRTGIEIQQFLLSFGEMTMTEATLLLRSTN